jgi:hypothetical protein
MLGDMEVVRWAALVARAGSAARARRLLADGEWWRVLRDAYAPREALDGPEVRVAAMRLVLPAHVAVSHRAALWVLGVDVLGRDRSGRDLIDVTAPRGLHLERRPGLLPHSALLPDEELCQLGGLLLVSAARAFVDVARSDSLVEAVAFGDAVLRSGAATPDQLAQAVDRAAGLRHVRRAREVLPHLEPRSESLMESRLRMRLVLGGLPRPEAQVDLYDELGHAGRSDLYLDGVVLEYDGREARLLKPVFVHERRRQNRLADLRLEIRRFTADDVFGRPAGAVCAEVRRALDLARVRDRTQVRRGPDTLRPPRLRPLPTRAQLARRTA